VSGRNEEETVEGRRGEGREDSIGRRREVGKEKGKKRIREGGGGEGRKLKGSRGEEREEGREKEETVRN